jgi:hypothetical protein
MVSFRETRKENTMSTIVELAKNNPVAFIVYAPPKELLTADPLEVERTVRSLESGIEKDMISFTENPQHVFTLDKHLSSEMRQVREANLCALEQGFFELLILAGSGISEYLRTIVRNACLSQIDISLYANEESLLSRYLHMQQSGILSKQRVA